MIDIDQLSQSGESNQLPPGFMSKVKQLPSKTFVFIIKKNNFLSSRSTIWFCYKTNSHYAIRTKSTMVTK